MKEKEDDRRSYIPMREKLFSIEIYEMKGGNLNLLLLLKLSLNERICYIKGFESKTYHR